MWGKFLNCLFFFINIGKKIKTYRKKIKTFFKYPKTPKIYIAICCANFNLYYRFLFIHLLTPPLALCALSYIFCSFSLFSFDYGSTNCVWSVYCLAVVAFLCLKRTLDFPQNYNEKCLWFSANIFHMRNHLS